MPNSIGISFKLPPMFSDAARNKRIMRRHVRRGVQTGVRLLHREIATRTPIDTRALRRGYFGHVAVQGIDQSIVLGFLRNPERHFRPVEIGRAPGRQPPTDALRGWAFRKLGNADLAYVVARAIGRRGIRARHMARDGFIASRARVKNRVQQGYVRGLREIRAA